MQGLGKVAAVAMALAFSLLTHCGEAHAQSCGCSDNPRCCKKHCRYPDPPMAPILGSAPAMMAPIVFTPVGPVANPQRPQQSPSDAERDTIRELLRLLLEESNAFAPREAQPRAAAAPPVSEAPRRLDEEDRLMQRLEQLDQQLRRLDRIEEMLSETAKAVIKLESRISTLENP